MDSKTDSIFPFGNKVEVLPIEADSTTQSGIILANPDNNPIKKGRVIQVGYGKYTLMGELLTVPVQLDATVWYYQQSATKITEDGVEHFFVDVDQILAWA